MESVNTEEKRLVRYQQMLEARAYSPALAADSALFNMQNQPASSIFT